MKFYVYILKCGDGSYYTGWTNDLQGRIAKHQKGKGAKYTRSHLPVQLHWWVECPSKSEAMKLEYKLKQQSHNQKKNLKCHVIPNN